MIKRIALLSAIIVSIVFVDRLVSQTEKAPPVVREWSVEDSKAYAKDTVQAWADNHFLCLEKLWHKESNWRPEAYNEIKVMGKNAGGIPQILGMSTQIPAPRQIDRGFAYIMHRYGTPCTAWKFHQRKGWY